jgi:glycosyltransferase involved in cell wall biosynthesis
MSDRFGYYYFQKACDAGGRMLHIARNLRSVTLKPATPPRGRVLLSYILDGFLSDRDQRSPSHPAYWHTNAWESRLMAQTFLDLGYQVDAISWLNRMFLPKGNYTAFVDVRHNMERLAPLVGPDCLKIMHLDAAHLTFLNAAESRRLLELQRRRGVTLTPRRFEPPNLGIEHADCATMLGNDFTRSTYRYAGKPIYPVPLPSNVTFPWPQDKNWEECARTFLWLGSGGLVHKGLDLVLEAFAAMPDFRLIVCGPVEQEPDFRRAFHRELYRLPNIETVGWVDTASQQFRELTRRTVAMVYPSCSEGQCGGVITCMHAGLIPIISCESGVDVDDFGLLLQSSSIGEIQTAVREISRLPRERLEQRARCAWETARKTYTRENYARVYREIVEQLLGRTCRKGAA